MRIIQKILNICRDKPVSLEVFADDVKNMISQGKKLILGKKCLCKGSCSKFKNIFT